MRPPTPYEVQVFILISVFGYIMNHLALAYFRGIS